jgi:hypothetical protein
MPMSKFWQINLCSGKMELYFVEIEDCYEISKEYRLHKNLNDLNELGRLLLSINNRPNNLTEDEKANVYDLYKGDMYFIAQTLRQAQKENRRFRFSVNGLRPIQLINLVLEANFMYETFTLRILDFIAIMLREFMKGITYFDRNGADQVHDRPIYHRTLSCGRQNALHELDCSGFYDAPQEFLRRSMKTRKCAIERQVYDKLFEKYFPSNEQDFGHRMMQMMASREDYFNKCFPNTTIGAKITFDQHGFPIGLTISQCNANKIIVERYKKDTNNYDPNVMNWNDISSLNVHEIATMFQANVSCWRLVRDRESLLKIYSKKIQSFNNPIDEWVVQEDSIMTNTFSEQQTRR